MQFAVVTTLKMPTFVGILEIMTRANSIVTDFFTRCFDSFKHIFLDYLEIATAVVVPRGVGKTSTRASI